MADHRRIAREDTVQQDEMEQQVTRWLKGLSATHRLVVERRFGLNKQEPASCEDLARELGLDAEQIRRMQLEALEILAADMGERTTPKDRPR